MCTLLGIEQLFHTEVIMRIEVRRVLDSDTPVEEQQLLHAHNILRRQRTIHDERRKGLTLREQLKERTKLLSTS